LRGGFPGRHPGVVSWHVRVIANRYSDSVRLMGIARAVRGREGVRRCELAMGTPANLDQLGELGLNLDAGPGDLLIAVEADDGPAEEALAAAENALSATGDSGEAPERVAPRSLAAAVRELAEANVALISVPGEYATLEAQRALSANMHVFLFSDHVPVEAERELKRRGAERGLLVMGPECGTAMLGGVGLGFANVVRDGSVGIVSAGGTGAQETACLLDALGAGVSQIVGVGGRDLSPEVGGIMFRQGMAMLAADEGTETLLLVSKPPAPEVVAALRDALPGETRSLAAFVGWEGGDAPFEVHPTLEAGALAAAGASPFDVSELEEEVDRRRSGGRLLGLYSGGSLAHEAATILEPSLGALGGNLGGRASEGGHAVFDLGEAEYTQGRPHPMVDLELRTRMLEDAGRDDSIGCVLLDVVLGHGVHPDPAGELATALERLAERGPVVARVCGTADDPQDARRQEATLIGAGAIVAPSNAAAARLALRAVRR
jgi:FdrA protein